MIDAKACSLNCERSTPACEYNGFGFSMMGSRVEVGCDAAGEDFETAAASAERGAVIKHENVRTGRGLAVPVTVRGGIFLGRIGGSSGLPFAELDTEGRVQIRDRGGRGVSSPEFYNGLTSVLAALHGGPIGNSAAFRATSFISYHPTY